MSYLLTTRAALRREFYALVGSVSEDGALTERGEAVDEIAHRALQFGLWNAQRHLIDIGAGADWLTTSAALTFAADPSGAQYASAPPDLLRFAGDEQHPTLREADGSLWGALLRDLRRRWEVSGNWYWWAGRKVWVAQSASLPSALYLDYYQKAALPDDDTTAVSSFPDEAAGLVPAEAAYYAMNQSWLPLGADVDAKIARSREYWRTEAAAHLRRTGSQTLDGPDVLGSHWML